MSPSPVLPPQPLSPQLEPQLGSKGCSQSKASGCGAREQEGIFHLKFCSKELDLGHVFAGAGCNSQGQEISSPIHILWMTCCKSEHHWQFI